MRYGLELDPALGEAALLAAEYAAARHEDKRALDYLARLVSADPRVRLRAALFAARLNHQGLHRLADAERAYRAALILAPDDFDANMGLAKLLGLCGRTREAVPNMLRIVRLGEPTDLLVLLARSDGVVHDLDALNAARRAAPEDANPRVGLAWHAASAEKTGEAVHLLREAIRLEPDHPAAHVALGKQLLVAGRFDELVNWSQRIPPAADEFADTWVVRARMSENAGDTQSAIRCLWEAVRRAPESKPANVRLARLLAEAGEVEVSERFAAQVRRIQELETIQSRVLSLSDRGNIEPLLELVQGYAAVGRLWEAYGWCQMAVWYDPRHEQARRNLEDFQQRVASLPLKMTVDSANPALAVDLSAYPLPRFRETLRLPIGAESTAPGTMSFQDDAASAELSFRYCNGSEDGPPRRMFEFTGGGIAVLDLDLDGFADLFFTQGRPWPAGPGSIRSGSVEPEAAGYGDRVFRNLGGARFGDITKSAGVGGGGFGQGVTVGDFNADGFPDLYAAHIGANRLWANNGDGTLSDVTQAAGVAGNHDDWTTSCVLADLDGDGLPDLYAANYVMGPDVFDRVCRHPNGAAKLCMPYDFDGQPDHLWLNEGDGRFTLATPDRLGFADRGQGLGVAVWDAHGTGRLSLLVANDTTPNFFFVSERGLDGRTLWRDRGIAAGLAFDGEGKAKGCMGITLGDVNDDGQLDVHITNFLNEASTFYMGLPGGAFEDRTREVRLHDPTLDVLGFGTQFLDVDLDGRLELFMANGHVDDLSQYGKPYKMPPKLFRWAGRRFVEVAAADLGAYFQKRWLGRAVARLDWNRDGREDLVVGHLADDVALLTNTTRDAGRFLSISLFGVRSNRDAIGTTVSAHVGERTIVRQLTAGDGYQASNERRLIFGLGNARHVDSLVVRWPSGIVQQFENVPTSQEACLTEGGNLVLANSSYASKSRTTLPCTSVSR